MGCLHIIHSGVDIFLIYLSRDLANGRNFSHFFKSSYNMENSLSFIPDESEESNDLSDIEVDASSSSDSVEENESESSEDVSGSIEGYTREEVTAGENVFVWENDPFFCNKLKKFKPHDNCYHNLDRFKLRKFMNQTALQFFWLFFPISFWETVVKYTNSYAKFHKAIGWKNLILCELLVWLLILLIFSVRKTPRLSDMWSRDDLFNLNGLSRFGMTYKRWKQIRKYLHVSPVKQPEGNTDAYFKIREMKQTLVFNSKLNIPYCEHYSVDEMTIGYQGRTTLIKKTPSKKVSEAFQGVALTTDGGFLIEIEFDREGIHEDEYDDLDQTSNRVLRIVKYLKNTNKFATLYMDNRFTKPLLFYYLIREYNLYALGTWRKNFGVPNLIKISKSKKIVDIDAAKER